MGLFGQGFRTAAQQVAGGGDGDVAATHPNFGQRLLNGVNAMVQNYGEMQGWPGAMERLQAQKIGQQNSAEYQRQAMLEQYKASNPGPTEMQRNYQYLMQTNPALAQTYLRAQANPMTLMTDPATGAVTFQPKGGPDPQQPGSQQPMSKVVNGQPYYFVNGGWYDNPEGR
jgi:hypothetical protein